ncbi:hypothetical protein WG78_14495 [Amantichitinum ursilacus]|uniref:Uncharacterized protein n=1 Tax=Amantichitinum ursilacus TaxID=857265 RepID=A0A0N1JSR8_9NEIS|nr:hypothetical protein WG78_14495 [Amantichitinum ursilacus]
MTNKISIKSKITGFPRSYCTKYCECAEGLLGAIDVVGPILALKLLASVEQCQS